MKQSDVEAIVDGTVERFGRIDILVNNAGGSFDNANVVDANPESFEAVLRWNVMSTFWATRRARQHMIPQRFGRIINTDIFLAEGPSAAEGMGITLDQLIELFTAESAIKRTNTVEEVASVALLLATDMAGGITGALYSIDGGTAAY